MHSWGKRTDIRVIKHKHTLPTDLITPYWTLQQNDVSSSEKAVERCSSDGVESCLLMDEFYIAYIKLKLYFT